jgi:hypothetical protein
VQRFGLPHRRFESKAVGIVKYELVQDDGEAAAQRGAA